MTTENLKSLSVTNLDSSPPVQNNVGQGAAGYLRNVSDTVTATTGMLATSTYRLCRFPCNAKVKHFWLHLDAGVTTFEADLCVAFSDSTVDGTSAANQGTIPQIASANNNIFGAAIDLHTITAPVDYAVKMGGANANKPMWAVLGMTDNPGGYFDILLVTEATTSGAPVIVGMVEFVDS